MRTVHQIWPSKQRRCYRMSYERSEIDQPSFEQPLASNGQPWSMIHHSETVTPPLPVNGSPRAWQHDFQLISSTHGLRNSLLFFFLPCWSFGGCQWPTVTSADRLKLTAISRGDWSISLFIILCIVQALSYFQFFDLSPTFLFLRQLCALKHTPEVT